MKNKKLEWARKDNCERAVIGRFFAIIDDYGHVLINTPKNSSQYKCEDIEQARVNVNYKYRYYVESLIRELNVYMEGSIFKNIEWEG
jgi:hypothetical protein